MHLFTQVYAKYCTKQVPFLFQIQTSSLHSKSTFKIEILHCLRYSHLHTFICKSDFDSKINLRKTRIDIRKLIIGNGSMSQIQ